jgi:Tfp pilus assembly protein PilW
VPSPTTSQPRKSPSPAAVAAAATAADSPAPPIAESSSAPNPALKTSAAIETPLDTLIGSPFKKARASVIETSPIDSAAAKKASEVFSSNVFNAHEKPAEAASKPAEMEEDEL